MTPLEVLEEMRALMSEGWTRCAPYRVPGCFLPEVSMERYLVARDAGEPHEACVEGALFAVIHLRGLRNGQTIHLLKTGVDSALRRAFEQGCDSRTIMNDALGSQEEALAWLSRAIILAREEGDA